MKLHTSTLILAIASFGLALPSVGHAQPAPTEDPSDVPEVSPEFDDTGEDMGDEVPNDMPDDGENPHGGQGFRPPGDGIDVVPDVPVGTILFALRDAYERPIAGHAFDINVLHSSVAQGDSRERFYGVTDDNGYGLAEGLAVGTGHSYTIRVTEGEGVYDLGPFGLNDKGGVSGVLHIYPATRDLTDLMLSAAVQVELAFKEDVIQVVYRVHYTNQSPVAWVADSTIHLPAGSKALTAPDEASPTFVSDGDTARMKGTVPPGELDTGFQFQVPLASDGEQTIDIGMVPNTAQTIVTTEASKSMGLTVEGFGGSKRFKDNGRSMLGAMRQMDKNNPDFLPSASIKLTGMPKRGAGAWLAIGSTVGAILLAGLYLYTRPKTGILSSDARDDLLEARQTLLDEFVALERARQAGTIGPKTYARVREAMLDALARIMDRLERGTPKPRVVRKQLRESTR
ncbi:MAG: hypothetical protein U0271_23530 [Polyangiaceae bacterium]